MKKFFVLFLLSMYCAANFAQNTDTLIAINGYYYTFFKKDEIISSYEQKIKKEKGESYSIPIDYMQFSFFVPTQIGDKFITNDGLNKSLDSIYFMPDDYSVAYIKRLFEKELDLTKEKCILSECNRTSQFYTFENNDNTLLKCYYLEGFAMIKRIANIEKERFKVNLDIYSVNKNAEYLTLIFIVTINNYATCITNQKMRLWQPYLNKITSPAELSFVISTIKCNFRNKKNSR